MRNKSMDWVQYGPESILLKLAEEIGPQSFQRSVGLLRKLEERQFSFVKEITPAFLSLLIEFDLRGGVKVPQAAREIVSFCEKGGLGKLELGPIREIPVSYGGEDMERVCDLHKLTAVEVVRLHSKPVYLVYCVGFSPGFAYLGDLPEKLHTPRLANPRPKVPAGSVAIGGEHTGVYSVESPGGWNLIGRTTMQLFRPAPPPDAPQAAFLLHHGDRVRFVPLSR